MDFTKVEKAEKTNSYGKVLAKTAEKIEKRIYDLAANEQLDIDVSKKEINDIVTPYADKCRLAALQFVKDTLDNVGNFVAVEIVKKKYVLELDYTTINNDLPAVIKVLENPRLIIPKDTRPSLIRSYNLIKNIISEGSQFFKDKSKNEKANGVTFDYTITSDNFTHMYSIFRLDTPGGIQSANAINALNGMMIVLAAEVQSDATITQLFEMGAEDVSRVINEVKAKEAENNVEAKA